MAIFRAKLRDDFLHSAVLPEGVVNATRTGMEEGYFPLIISKYQVSEFSARPAGCLEI
jgi:hypothetical protein